MIEEEALDCVIELDVILKQIEESLSSKDYKHALSKIKEARASIEELREDDESEIDSSEGIGMDMMKNLK